MFQDTRPVSFDVDDDDPSLAEFRLKGHADIGSILRSLMNLAAPINLSGSDGSGYRSNVVVTARPRR